MTPERTDLIEKLKALEPTEGEWIDSYGLIESNDVALFDRRSATTTDCLLITLAPTMRLEILAMAKEIENMHEEIRLSRIRQSLFSDFRNEILNINSEKIKEIDNKYFPF